MVRRVIAAIRIQTSNSSSNRSGAWKSQAVARRGNPICSPTVAILRPASRHSACSASSMYLKNQLKCTRPAMSVSWNWTRRWSRCWLTTVALGRRLADQLALRPAQVVVERLEQRRQVGVHVADQRVHDLGMEVRVHLEELAEAERQVVEREHQPPEAHHR